MSHQQESAQWWRTRYGQSYYGPDWAAGHLFRPNRDVCAMPYSTTQMAAEAQATYGHVKVRVPIHCLSRLQ